MLVLQAGRLYGAREVFVGWLGYRRLRWYQDNKQRLKERGFPQPIPKPGRARWRGEDLIAWAAAKDVVDKAVNDPASNVYSLGELARARSAALVPARRKAARVS